MRALPLLLAFGFAFAACQLDGGETEPTTDPDPAPAPDTTSASGRISTTGGLGLPSADDLEGGRYTGRGRDLVEVDTAGQAAAARTNPETLAAIDTTEAWSSPIRVPLGGDVAGPSVVKLQTLLDRAGFSPGQIDGRWGDNTELALSWFQKAEGLRVTGIADRATVRSLSQRAGQPGQLITTVTLSEDAVAGPFTEIPDDVYAKAELDRLGYESLSEKLGERFHAAPELLARLNGGRDLDALSAGDTLRVPNVGSAPRPSSAVSRLVISSEAGYLHALADDGTVLFHAPVTVGASYDPSPEGAFEVRAIARNPEWHYQPAILESVPDDAEEATLPPGPNNAVGVVWMALSKEHYGIHGTSAPETIGYASSAGCVRLTNWDAERLAAMIEPGVPVRFRDVAGRPGQRAPTDTTTMAARSR
ncbi:L,D-transpeptidase family protein [Rubrivirga marina]|uniref:L,D-TPase catalytic domain-containing protein n=1 Tax=Rubrivirga marina TaxID=1196024 RepID=A0A271IVJ8_9BACT|nr:L,D-transpeptidase family protein [Rubrivirga marina]PAP75281.1 hypothetical protein BSZ37_01890 [Rubrivirga marina]